MKAKELNLEYIIELYEKYRDDLENVRDDQRAFHQAKGSAITPQLDDLEAEITYLLLREHQPRNVIEIGTFYGWSTTWILSALRDNGHGRLISFDIVDHVLTHVPPALAKNRWTFTKGDVRGKIARIPQETDYLFMDAAHNGWFARWYISHLFPRLRPHIPVSVHDVFHQRYALPFTEGAVVLKWLSNNNTDFFTASPARAPRTHHALHQTKKQLDLDTPIRHNTNNPMIFFRLPQRPRPGTAIAPRHQHAQPGRPPTR